MKKMIIYSIAIAMVFISVATTNLSAQTPGGSASKTQNGIIKTVVALTGKVINGVTKEPISIKITVYDEYGKKITSSKSNSSDGYYYLTKLRPGHTYYCKINSLQYLKDNFEIKIPHTDKYLEFSRDFIVYPISAQVKIKLNVSPFEINNHKIKYGYAILLDDYLNLLLANPDTKFSIECYPDNTKDKMKNMQLTKRRAESLKDFFTINGVNPEKIRIKGNIEADPNNPIPDKKASKGNRYIGTTQLVIN